MAGWYRSCHFPLATSGGLAEVRSPVIDSMHEGHLPREIAALIGAELASGERIVWAGQPMPGRFARGSIGVVLFGIPWTAFAIFWMAGASGFKMPNFSNGFGFFPLFGVPFVLIGFGMLSAPYWARRKAQRTAYVITDRRALILAGGAWKSTTVRSFEPYRLADLRRVQYPDGTGDLIFERTWKRDSDGDRQSADHGFLAIREVKAVEGFVRQLANASPPHPAPSSGLDRSSSHE
jgi:hypothetical protein